MGKILRVNMNTKGCEFSEAPEKYRRLGGRGLTSTIVANEVAPKCHPLGRHNVLAIAPGILGGTTSPCSQRLSVGAKSPLTSGIKEANVGGTSGQKLARLGIASVVLAEKASQGELYLLHISKDGARLESAKELKGKGNYELAANLKERYGKQVGTISIGPAGEMFMSSATLAVTDKDGYPSRHAARGGLGAVMGSKGLKAIVIDDTGAAKTVNATDRDAFNATVKEFVKVILARPRVKDRLPIYGTAGLIPFANEVNSFPTRNFRSGQFEGMERISGETIGKIMDERGGERGHSCYAGCIVRCSNVYMDATGKQLTSSLEYETLGMLGANCCIDDVDIIATMDRYCDDYGIDTIEFGVAMGVAMEAGLLPFGDGPGAVKLLHEVGKGTPLGRILGNGAAITGKVFGVTRVPVIKGQGLPAWDPRTALATGVTFMTSPQGADHTAGRLQGVMEFSRLTPGSIAPLSKDMQIRACAYDSIGLCHFADGTTESIEWLAKLLSAFYGEDFTIDDVMRLGRNILETELKFNRAAGIDKSEDALPEFMMEEPLLPTNSTFNVAQQEIDDTFADLLK